jgi:Fe-S-cluster-containing dehydrogenase component
MQFDEERDVALMCDLCYERLKRGEAPACSTVCPTRCILWGDMKTISEGMEQRLL